MLVQAFGPGVDDVFQEGQGTMSGDLVRPERPGRKSEHQVVLSYGDGLFQVLELIPVPQSENGTLLHSECHALGLF